MSKLNKDTWNRVKFGDVCHSLNETVRDALEAGLERYVGLEHIETGNLHISKWGNIIDGTTFTRVFRAGSVLFGKRRAYQRKAAVVEFEGLCSSDLLVLVANEERLDPRLLPFIIHTDGFFNHAVSTSAGSLSPRTKFKDLAEYEFLLPPKNQQSRLADLLWAADDSIQAKVDLVKVLNNLEFSARRKFLFEQDDLYNLERDINTGKIELPLGWKLGTVGADCLIRDNFRKPVNRSERAENAGDYPYYGPTGILDFINEYKLDGEFVLIGEDGDHFLKYSDWEMTQLVSGKFNVNNHAHILLGTEACLTEWIYIFFKHRDIITFLTKQGSNRYKLTKGALLTLPILVPPVDEQLKTIRYFSKISSNRNMVQESIQLALKLRQALSNEIQS